MNNVTNFYDTLDLKYPEIGIAIQDIDRANPGKVKIIIPILTPNMDNTKIIEKVVYQNNYNLQNARKNAVNIQNIKLTNYIEIPFPKEICTTFDGDEENIIKSGSKWLIVFVGGDITKPRPISRYID